MKAGRFALGDIPRPSATEQRAGVMVLVQFQHLGDGVIEKGPIMRHDHHPTGSPLHP